MQKEDEIGHVIKCLSNEIRRYMVCRDSERGITRTQGLIIGYLHHESGKRNVFQRDIETQFNIRRSTVAEILKLMEKNGLIERTGVKEDARLKKITLTSKAEKIHETVQRDIERVERQLRRGISEEEMKSFVATVRKMQSNLAESQALCESDEHKIDNRP